VAKTTVVTITDDLDGSPSAETLRFSVANTTYEIDLAPKNREKFDKALAPFIQKATRVGAAPRARGVRGSGRSKSAANPNAEADRVARAWAQSTGYKVNGKPVSSRGRLHPEVRQAWIDAGRPS
jgi:hypothetical protein